ncbi:MAG: hypothetical protein IJD52_00655 [Alphaproteobacteria bacterium]|nr:hypothetical protein [Alphaproteobacteria bacterium]
MSNDDVEYRLSKKDCDYINFKLNTIQDLLHVQDPHSLIVEHVSDIQMKLRQVINGAERTNSGLNVESLTPEKMRKLFGRNYKGVLYYDFDSDVWNTDTYMGVPISCQHVDTKDALRMKKSVEKEKLFKPFDLVAAVIMAIDAQNYNGDGQLVAAPRFNYGGTAAVGNVVCRDKNTGLILPVSNNWIGIAAYSDKFDVAEYAADAFANAMMQKHYMRRILLENIGRVK